MPSTTPSDSDDREDRLQRLAAAMDAFLQFRGGRFGGDREAFLAAHAPLRDVLEPMFADADDADAEAFAAPQPGRCLGDFRLLREVGRGGMGVVYEAEQISLRRRVALKALPPHLTSSPRAIERFRHEAALASRLRHAAIVPIHEVGEWRGIHYYTMEFVAGRPLHVAMLDERLGVRSDCSRVAEAAELVARLAEALHHAHEHGLVHRDVKPHNVMIGADGSVRLMDFGVAKDLDAPSRSTTGEFLGTPHYASPEQVTGGDVGPTSDVFALGIVLYELLARRRPFDGGDARAVLRRIEIGEFPSLRSVAPTVPRDLQIICHKALERSPGHRYASAGEFADDLRRFLRIEPIHATPPSVLTRSTKWVRRHRLRLAVVTLAALATVGAPAAYAWHLHRTHGVIANERAVLDQAEELGFRSIEQTLALLGEQLDRQPGPGDRHAPQVDAAVQLCESFLALRSELPSRRRRAAASLEVIAGIYAHLDRPDAARAACDRATQLLALADAADPVAPAHDPLRGRLLHRVLQVEQASDLRGSELAFTAAVEHWQAAAAAAPDGIDAPLALARTLLLRARALAEQPDRRGDADVALTRAAAVLRAPRLAALPAAQELAVRVDAAIGQLLLANGRTEAAHALLVATLPCFDALTADASVGADKAQLLAAMGTALQRLERPQHAAAVLRDAIATATHWSTAYPGSPQLRRTLAASHVALASQLLVQGDHETAERHLRQAAPSCVDPGTHRMRSPGPLEQALAADFAQQLADCLLLRHPDRSHDDEALDLLEQAVRLRGELVAAMPDDMKPRIELAVACNSLAMFCNERGDHAGAAEHAACAVTHQEAALAKAPDDRRARTLLGIHHGHLAFALARLGRGGEALRSAQQALANAPRQVATLRFAAEAAARAAAPGAVPPDATDAAAALAVEALDRIAAVDRREARRLLADRRFTGLREREDFIALQRRLQESP